MTAGMQHVYMYMCTRDTLHTVSHMHVGRRQSDLIIPITSTSSSHPSTGQPA
jgi:hypothetical protein